MRSFLAKVSVSVSALLLSCSDGSEIVRRQLRQEQMGSGNQTSTGGSSVIPSAGTGGVTPTAGTESTLGGTPTGTGGTGNSDAGTGMTQGGSGNPMGGEAQQGGSGGAAPVDPYVGPFKILVFSTTLEFRHDSIPNCQALLTTLGQTQDGMQPQGTKPGSQWKIDIAKDDLSDFTDANLKNYGMLFWCSPTGTVFSSGGMNGQIGMAAVQKFVEGGGAWGGVHSATDFEKTNGFPWFTNTLIGGYFEKHDGDGTPGTVQVQQAFANHPVMRGITPTWSTQDEWYFMNKDITALPDFLIMAKLTSDQRPVIWAKELGPAKLGRMVYTIRGHNKTVYDEPDFKRLIQNSVLWATHRLN